MIHALKALGFLWCLPNTLIGLLMGVFYGARDWEWRDWALVATCKRIIGDPGAQTWGAVVYANGERNRRRIEGDQPLWRHEYLGHVYQAMMFGVFFLLAYGLEWLVRFAFLPGGPVDGYGARGEARWFRAYYRLTWEKWARAKE